MGRRQTHAVRAGLEDVHLCWNVVLAQSQKELHAILAGNGGIGVGRKKERGRSRRRHLKLIR